MCIRDRPEAAKKCIGYLPEMPPLYFDMTVLEYMKFAADLKKIPRNQKDKQIKEVMDMVKITDMKDRLIKNLSKGYRQRVGLAQAILGYPEVIILDEPTVGLDPKQIIEIRDLIKGLKQKHTVILSSHILSEVRAVCDYVLIISHGKLVGTISKKHIKNGSYSMAMAAVFIVIVVVINMIVGAIPSKYSQLDVSSSKLYTIGDETKKVLKALDKDVTIYQIAASGSEDDTISNLLSRYKDESKHIKVEVKDPVVNPKFASEYTTDDLASNSLIVVCGDRNKVINYNDMYSSSVDYNTWQQTTTGFDGEGQITSAIGYVTSEDLPIMYTLSGHGEKDLDSSFKEDIQKANIDIKELNLLTEGKVPDDADCLMIVSPTSDISEEEKTELLDYLEAGGKAMIFSDYTQDDLPNFDAVLENYGVKCAEGIVFEGDNQHYGMQMPYYLVPTVNSTDASSETASAGSYVLAPYAQGIQKTDDVRDTVTIDSILTTSDKAYSKTNMQSSNIEKEDGDVDGPFDLGVAITEKLDDDKETQIVYYSTANLMESQINQMVSGGNEKLLLESLNWMTSTDDSNSVSIPSKSLESTSLTVTDYDAAFWKICTIGLIPGVFLVAGFLIWLKRRKA